MNLHRTLDKPDWELVGIDKRNQWQKIASATKGVVTPGNVLTAIGFLVVVGGLLYILDTQYWLGGLLVIVGRLFDLADGWAAEHTGTKSPAGEVFDTAADKLLTGLTIIVFGVAVIAPWWLLIALLLPHVVIVVITAVARYRQRFIHPTRVGKISMALLWVGVTGLLLVKAMNLAWNSQLGVLVALIVSAAITTGVYAAVQYANAPAKSDRL